jgi:hypothetical protein
MLRVEVHQWGLIILLTDLRLKTLYLRGLSGYNGIVHEFSTYHILLPFAINHRSCEKEISGQGHDCDL